MITFDQAAKPWRAPCGDIRDALDKIEKRIEKYFENVADITTDDADKLSSDIDWRLRQIADRAEKLAERACADYRAIERRNYQKKIKDEIERELTAAATREALATADA